MTRIRQLSRAIALLTFIALIASCSSDTSNTGSVTFALTDAPSDDLSALQVEITEVRATDILGAPTRIFPAVPGETLVVNLLRLRDLHFLLGNHPVGLSAIDELVVSFENASAVDNAGNLLTVTPAAATVTVELDPPIAIGRGNVFVELDFDVDDSVDDLTLGAGGSLTLNPTILVDVTTDRVRRDIDDVEGVVIEVESRRLVVALGFGDVTVRVDGSTEIETDDAELLTSSSVDLGDFFSSGDRVEVEGWYLPAENTILADKIELQDDDGTRFEGVVVRVDTTAFDVLVTDTRNSGLAVGSTQTITVAAGTAFEYKDPPADADAARLALGQRVQVRSSPAAPTTAIEVELRKTRLEGLITSLTADLGATLAVARVEGILVAAIPGYPSSTPLVFEEARPAHVVAGADVHLKGHFHRSAAGVFDVQPNQGNNDDDDDGDDTGEVADEFHATLSGSQVVPPVATEASGKAEFELDAEGTLSFELEVGNIDDVTAAHIHAGPFGEAGPILATLYFNPATASFTESEEIAEGTLVDDDLTPNGDFDGSVGGLLDLLRSGAVFVDVHTSGQPASELRGQVAPEADDDDDSDGDDAELEGATYEVDTLSPLTVQVTGTLEVDGSETQTTVSVVPGSDVVIVQRDDTTHVLTEIDLLTLSTGLGGQGFAEIQAEGDYDESGNLLVATKLIVTLAP